MNLCQQQKMETKLFTRTDAADCGTLFILTGLTVFQDELRWAVKETIQITNPSTARIVRIPLQIKRQQQQQQKPPQQLPFVGLGQLE